jgi:hypothetical protein
MPSYGQFDVWQNTAGVNRQTVVQTKYVHKGSTFSASVSGDSFYDVTGMSIVITPNFTNSLILLKTTLWVGTTNYQIKYRISRSINGSVSYPILGDAEGGRPQATGMANYYSAVSSDMYYNVGSVGGTHIDVPGTISAITYSVQISSYSGQTVYLNRSPTWQNNAAAGYDSVPVSSFIIQEILQ